MHFPKSLKRNIFVKVLYILCSCTCVDYTNLRLARLYFIPSSRRAPQQTTPPIEKWSTHVVPPRTVANCPGSRPNWCCCNEHCHSWSPSSFRSARCRRWGNHAATKLTPVQKPHCYLRGCSTAMKRWVWFGEFLETLDAFSEIFASMLQCDSRAAPTWNVCLIWL